jgi:hypothetical protein
MHSVIVLADHHLSYAAVSETSHPPIGAYPRAPVEIHETDPHAAEVAGRLIALIATSRPGAVAEHVGSSAVPGLAGRGHHRPAPAHRPGRPQRRHPGPGRTRLPVPGSPGLPPDPAHAVGRPAAWVHRLPGARPRGTQLQP